MRRLILIPILLAALPACAGIARKPPKPANADLYRAEPDHYGHDMLTVLSVSHKIGISAGRVRQIQIALRARGYTCPVNGRLDRATLAAMIQIQQQNGWQTRHVPDARLLDWLGLGARHNYLGNTNTEARK